MSGRVVIGLGWLLARLPHRFALWLGARFGDLSHRMLRSRRLVAKANIDACFAGRTPAERQRLVRETFRETGRGLVDTAIAWWGHDHRLNGLADIEGSAHLENAYRHNQGVIVLIAHYPSLEIGGRLLNLTQPQAIRAMARQHNNPILDAEFDRRRRHHCEVTFGKTDVRGLLKSLKDNRAVFYAADQNFNRGVVFAPLFGRPAACTTALSDLVARTGAAVVPMWCWRRRDGRYQIKLEPAWEHYPGATRKDDARRMNAWIEDSLADNPAQYLWLHRRFKKQPDDRPFYQRSARRAKHR